MPPSRIRQPAKAVDVPTIAFDVSGMPTTAFMVIDDNTGTTVGSARVTYTTNLSAIEVRRQWMTMMGLHQDEIDQYCSDDAGADLDEELRQLEAMIEVQDIYGKLRSSR